MSMAAAAEQFPATGSFNTPPLVFNIAEIPEDKMMRARGNQFIRSVGTTAIGSVEITPVVETTTGDHQVLSMQESIHNAAWGNEKARRLVHTNAKTTFIEQGYKAGVIVDIKLEADETGRISQHGQPMDSVFKNSLLHASATPEIRGRSEAETRNGFRLEQLRRQGMLNEYYFVVISRCANLPDEELTKNGFFAATKSCVIQATTESEDGLGTKSAFVAGVKTEKGPRHDEETVIGMGSELGVNYAGKSATQIIDEPLLIHKSKMPNGVADLVKLYDKHAGGTFFGQDKPVQDYQEFEKFCKQREKDLEPTINLIVDQLIDEASSIHTPIAAVKRLHKIAESHLVTHAIKVDKTIDANVFGKEAAVHIEEARIHAQNGNFVLAESAEAFAKDKAKTTSCPSALKKNKFGEMAGENGEDPETTISESDELTEPTESTESKIGKIRCIKCRKYVNKAEVVKEKEDCWECPKCKHRVNICTGEIENEGESGIDNDEKVIRLMAMIFSLEKVKEEKTKRQEEMPVAA